MRILMYCPNYLPATRYGGPVRSSHGLARALVALGHQVTVLTTNLDGPDKLEVPVDRAVELDGVQIHYCAVTGPTRLYFSPALADLAERMVPEMDMVHVNGVYLWPGPVIGRLALKYGVMLIMSPRGMLVPELVKGKSRLAKTLWIATQERHCLERAQAIHVTSEIEASELQRMGFCLPPVAVIGNGVDGPERPVAENEISEIWGDVPAGSRVAFLGRLDWTKGVDMAIDAVRAHPSAVIRLAGHDQLGLRGHLESRLVRNDGTCCGAFLGPLDGARKWAFLAGADVLLVPSVRESFCMSAAESLLMGTPVIATEGVGLASILRRLDPSLVVPRDQHMLFVALESLLADENRRSCLSLDAANIAKTAFSWSTVALRFAALHASRC